MQNSIWLYRLYDVAEEINLDTVENILAHQKPTARLNLKRIRPKSMQFKNPPVSFELDLTDINLLGQDYRTFVSGRVYELGVISIIFRIQLPEEVDMHNLTNLSAHLYHTDQLERLFENYLATTKSIIGPALIKADDRIFSEDFTIFYFRQWQKDWDPAPLLLAETEPISAQTRTDTLQHTFSYGPKDQTIITWDSALVYDADGSSDVCDLLEFGLAQLLELRYYDSLLSIELEHMYGNIEAAQKGGSYSSLNNYRRIMKEMMELVADITEFTERVHNSLKVTEDIFYARIYSSALTIFRTKVWSESIQRKISVIERTYAMLSDEIVTHRAALMELAIIFLFVLEIILGFMPFFH